MDKNNLREEIIKEIGKHPELRHIDSLYQYEFADFLLSKLSLREQELRDKIEKMKEKIRELEPANFSMTPTEYNGFKRAKEMIINLINKK